MAVKSFLGELPTALSLDTTFILLFTPELGLSAGEGGKEGGSRIWGEGGREKEKEEEEGTVKGISCCSVHILRVFFGRHY